MNPDADLVISGSAALVRSLLSHGLVDELRLLAHPIVVGHGTRRFEDNTAHSRARGPGGLRHRG